jgi:xanthine dehydrogenase FAD-binding subunit
MYDIETLYEATSVEDACRALAEDPQAIVIAGGTDVLVKVRGGKLAGAHLVSIHNLHDELDGVTLADDGTVEIGPITWFHHVTTSPVIQTTVPTLGEACDTPGGPQLRVSGTIGGNVCNAATSADSASTLFAYGRPARRGERARQAHHPHRGVVCRPRPLHQGARRGTGEDSHPA